MREIVCLGTRSEVSGFLAQARDAVSLLLGELDLPVSWDVATDPFFQPAKNPKYVAQRLQPTKHEARFEGDLAIASVNLHEDHFGAAFGITRADRPAVSGCMAFGMERWVYAITRRYGPDPAPVARPRGRRPPRIGCPARLGRAACGPGRDGLTGHEWSDPRHRR